MTGVLLDRQARARLPAALVRELPDAGTGVGIVHLGVGAFHRAHQAVLTQLAMAREPGDWAICAAAPRSRAVVDHLRRQDGLYTVTERETAGDRFRVVGAIGAALAAADHPDEFAAAIAAPTTHVVTLTVTEAGYRRDARTGRLSGDDPEIAADLAGRPPRTAIGQLTRGLQARCRAGAPPLTVLSCDNLLDNGPLVRGLVESFCTLLPAREGEPLWEWVRDRVAFPSTVVDQIVPATTPADRARVAGAFGVADHAAVVGEAHRAWVIEDRFAGPRPAWEAAGARLVPDIHPDQTAKLRGVNGAHSALAHLGLLVGARTVCDAVGDPDLRHYLIELLRHEIGPSLARHGAAPPDPPGLLARFANPRLEHRLSQIAALGPQKLPQRLLEPARELLDAGRTPVLTCLAVAAWVRLLWVTTDERLALDPASERLRATLRAVPASDVGGAVTEAGRHLPDLSAGHGALRDHVTDALGRLVADGTRATVRAALR